MRYGAVIKAPSGFPVQSPFLAIANKAHEQMVKLLTEFGMTPAARTRVVRDAVHLPKSVLVGLLVLVTGVGWLSGASGQKTRTSPIE